MGPLSAAATNFTGQTFLPPPGPPPPRRGAAFLGQFSLHSQVQNRSTHRAPASPLKQFSYFSFIVRIASASGASSPRIPAAQAASSAAMMHKGDTSRNLSLSPLPSPKVCNFPRRDHVLDLKVRAGELVFLFTQSVFWAVLLSPHPLPCSRGNSKRC